VGLIGSHTTGHSKLFKIASTKEVRNMVSHTRLFDISEVAKERKRIIDFYGVHGEKTTFEAFGVGRKTISVWKRRLKLKGLFGLVPYSTAPKRRRSMLVNEKVLLFIKSLREKYPNLGKTKVKIILDQFCLQEKLPLYSEAKVGRIIKFYKLFYQKQGKMYHNPNSKYATKRHKTKRLRIKYSPKPTDFGYIQMDTVTRLVDGVKYYFYDAVDTKGKFALSLPYKHLNSKNTVDFMKKLLYVLPSKITTVQTDNGLEFLGEFEKYLQTLKIKHIFTYPRCPKINGVVERFNRTLNEQFILPNLHLIHSNQEFSLKLSEFLIFYNNQRPHQTLNNMTPLQYLYQKGEMSKMYRASTGSGQI
jgi:transposase InsO family protein